jgi:hypothetical protein
MNNWLTLLEGRKIVIGTKHQKESILGPMLEKELHVNCAVTTGLDTDQLGTFSGEIERIKSPIETVRAKCLLAMDVEKVDLAIATEGSFGSHPTALFAYANDEIIMLLDQKNNIEIVERVLSLETNFDAQEIHSFSELEAFTKKAKFPSHGVILKDKKKKWNKIVKGIQSPNELNKVFHDILKDNPSCYVETDMRASCNPTRMKVIEEACSKLIRKIKSACPNCQYPGFGVVRAEAGLLCNSCKRPTRSIFSHIYQCKNCDFEQKKKYPYDKETEDPMYCDYCNP